MSLWEDLLVLRIDLRKGFLSMDFPFEACLETWIKELLSLEIMLFDLIFINLELFLHMSTSLTSTGDWICRCSQTFKWNKVRLLLVANLESHGCSHLNLSLLHQLSLASMRPLNEYLLYSCNSCSNIRLYSCKIN